MPRDADDPFDEPSRWRVGAARALGLRGLDLAAALAPAAGFPATLRPLVRHVQALSGSPPRVVDAGAGLGGTAEWLRASTGAEVIAVEPAMGAAVGAAALFAGVHTVRGSVMALPLASGAADAAVVVGVLSLVEAATAALTELARVVRPGGIVAISDLVLDRDDGVRRSGPNHFRSVRDLLDQASRAGLHRIDVGVGTTDTGGPWRELAEAVDAEVAARHHHDAAYPAWSADQAHLRDELASGRLLAATITLRRADQAGRSDRRSAPTAITP